MKVKKKKKKWKRETWEIEEVRIIDSRFFNKGNWFFFFFGNNGRCVCVCFIFYFYQLSW